MALYDVTIFLAGGAIARIKKKEDTSAKVLQLIEDQLGDTEFKIESETETAVLIIKYPAVNIVGYFVDEIG